MLDLITLPQEAMTRPNFFKEPPCAQRTLLGRNMEVIPDTTVVEGGDSSLRHAHDGV